MGFDQILWLFGEDRQVTEAGASNFFIIWKNKDSGKLELVTAPLENQLILPGVTRRSVLELVNDRLSKESVGNLAPLKIVERAFTIGEIEEAAQEGRVLESFVSGTAVSWNRLCKPSFKLTIRHSTSLLLSIRSIAMVLISAPCLLGVRRLAMLI